MILLKIQHQRMKGSKLATYFSDICKYETRVEIARQILAHNMNFSPAWIIALLMKKNEAKQEVNNNSLKIFHFKLLFDIIQLILTNQEAILVFEYFDKQNLGLVKNEDFIQSMLPTLKQGLRKAALKRIAQDLQLSNDLKYALRRFFTQILAMKSGLKLYQGQFGPHSNKFIPQKSFTKQKICQFMKDYKKYLTESQLTLLSNFILQERTKQLSINQVFSIIQQNHEQIQYLAKNPTVLNQKFQNELINLKVKQLQAAQQTQKILRKGQIQSIYNKFLSPKRQLPEKQNRQNQRCRQQTENQQFSNQPYFGNLKITRTNSILQNQQRAEQPQVKTEFNKASVIADKLLLGLDSSRLKKNQNQQKVKTPLNRLDLASISTPTIYYSSRRKNRQSDIAQLTGTNDLLEDQIAQAKRQNQARTRKIKQELNHMTNI